MAKIKIVRLSQIRGRRIDFNDLFTAREKTRRAWRSILGVLGVIKTKG